MPETLPVPEDHPELKLREGVDQTTVLIDLLVEISEEANTSNNLVYRVASWSLMIKILTRLEDAIDTTDARWNRTHEFLLRGALMVGDYLLSEQTPGKEFTRASHGLSKSDIEANLQWLRDKQVMWHTEVTPQRRSKILADVFGVQASAA